MIRVSDVSAPVRLELNRGMPLMFRPELTLQVLKVLQDSLEISHRVFPYAYVSDDHSIVRTTHRCIW